MWILTQQQQQTIGGIGSSEVVNLWFIKIHLRVLLTVHSFSCLTLHNVLCNFLHPDWRSRGWLKRLVIKQKTIIIQYENDEAKYLILGIYTGLYIATWTNPTILLHLVKTGANIFKLKLFFD